MFTAPVKGVYVFTFVVYNTLEYVTEVKLMRNGEMVVSATENLRISDSDGRPTTDTEDTTTNSATLLLEKSDQVYIELPATKGIHARKRRNTFSGYLLYPLQ